VSQATAFDQLAVRLLLLLELGQRAGVHHCAAGLKLMNMNVYQGAASSAKKVQPKGNVAQDTRNSSRFHLCGANEADRRGDCDRNCLSTMDAAQPLARSPGRRLPLPPLFFR
jgi:hypothetical protein